VHTGAGFDTADMIVVLMRDENGIERRALERRALQALLELTQVETVVDQDARREPLGASTTSALPPLPEPRLQTRSTIAPSA
jgi:hypothetical protein